MVYCTKCGANNQEDAKHCAKCGAPLYAGESEGRRKERRDECFGLPHGGAIAGLIFGILVMLWGTRELFGWSIDFGPFMMIVIGLLIVGGAVYGLSRKRG